MTHNKGYSLVQGARLLKQTPGSWWPLAPAAGLVPPVGRVQGSCCSIGLVNFQPRSQQYAGSVLETNGKKNPGHVKGDVTAQHGEPGIGLDLLCFFLLRVVLLLQMLGALRGERGEPHRLKSATHSKVDALTSSFFSSFWSLRGAVNPPISGAT